MLLTSILVQGKRRNKVLRESLHQVRRVGAPKRAKDLVQRKRKNKGLRESLHQVQRVEAPKRTKDLVQEKRKNKVLRESLHQVRSGGAPLRRNPMSKILYVVIPPTRIPYFLAMKEAAVPSAQRLLPYIMLFLELQVQRQRPRHSYGDRKSGEALCAPAAPHQRGEAFACPPGVVACTSRAYIGRLGMRTVKVVPLPGTLST